MENKRKWIAVGMMLALGISIFLTNKITATAVEVEIPYTPSDNCFTTGIDGASLCLNLRNANNCICEDIPQAVNCSGYIEVTFSISGIGENDCNLRQDGTDGEPYFAKLVGVVGASQGENVNLMRFCDSEEDVLTPGMVEITGDGIYTVRTELTQDVDTILSLAVDTNIDIYRYQKDGNVSASGITMNVNAVTTEKPFSMKTIAPEFVEEKEDIAVSQTAIFSEKEISAPVQTEAPIQNADSLSTTTTTTGKPTMTTTYRLTTSKKAASIRGYYIAALNNVDTIKGIGETLQLFIGNNGSSVSSLNRDIIPVWTSFHPDVATVDETGLVTAVSAGTATIAAVIYGNTCSIEITVSMPTTTVEKTMTSTTETTGFDAGFTMTSTVTKPAATTYSVVSVRSPQIVTINNIKRITSENPQLQLYFLNVMNPHPIWSSFNPSIASVDENGVVTGLSAGTAVIGAMIDGNVYQITLYVVDEEIGTTIGTPTTTTTTTVTKPMNTEGSLKGDINEDGIISVEDAVLVLEYYAKKSAGLNPTWEDILKY